MSTNKPRASARLRFALIGLALLLPAQVPLAEAAQGNKAWLVVVDHRIDLMQRFPRQYEPPSNQNQTQTKGRPKQVSRVRNLTAGVVADKNGHIVTRLVNYNPALPPEEILISTADGRALAARIVGMDFPSGFVVLNVLGLKGIEPAPIAAPPTLGVGSAIRVISPDYATTQSNMKNQSRLRGPIPGKVVQTTTPGIESRGGVLFTFESPAFSSANDFSLVETPNGTVVGVAKYVSDNVGSVYSIEFVRSVADRVVRMGGHVQPAWLGADGRFVSQSAGFNRAGFLVESVAPRSPAEKAGIETGDVIVELDGRPVSNEGSLASALAATPSGSAAELTLSRSDKPVKVNVTLGVRVPKVRNANSTNAPRVSGPGLSFVDMKDQLSKFFGVSAGALVDHVVPASAAAAAGIQAGDVVVRIGSTPVSDRSEAASALNEAMQVGTPSVEIELIRERKPVVVTLSLQPVTSK